MNVFFGSVWWMIVTLGLLITFHEFGHFWVARRCGVKVLRFSIGFGKTLWSRVDRHGTEFIIAAIPLGGYVKMLDEREGDVPASELAYAHNRKSVPQRMAIAAAGPAANLLFAVVALWLMFIVGKPDFLPIIGTPQELAASAGFQAGDRLLSIDDQPVEAWGKAILKLSEAAIARNDARITVLQSNGNESTRVLPFSQLAESLSDKELFKRMGLNLKPPTLPPVVDRVVEGYPAKQAGFIAGDRILTLNGHQISAFNDLEPLMQTEAAKDPALTLTIERNGSPLTLPVVAQNQPNQEGKPHWIIGIGSNADPHDAVLHFGPLKAVPAAFNEAWDITVSSLTMLKQLIVGKAGLDNISGVITIARYANDSAQLGFAWFLNFLALISLSLGIMNLLPIPVLDGGHLVYYFIELIKGSPVSERMQIAGQYVGVMLLVALMSLALYNDILRLVS